MFFFVIGIRRASAENENAENAATEREERCDD